MELFVVCTRILTLITDLTGNSYSEMLQVHLALLAINQYSINKVGSIPIYRCTEIEVNSFITTDITDKTYISHLSVLAI